MNKATISPAVSELIKVFQDQRGFDAFKTAKEDPRVKTHETVAKAAFMYEKVRNAIDYQEEHLIRKNSIARMLKRRILMRERGTNIAEPLIRELIRAGYLKNDYFPVARIPDIERIINKYVVLTKLSSEQQLDYKSRNRLFKWIISVASFELEEYLNPSIKDDALVECMYKIIRPQIDISEEIVNSEDQDIQIYIAIHKALIKSDASMLRYHLIHYYAPGWRYATSAEIPTYATYLPGLVNHIEQQLNNLTADRLFRYVRRFAPIFITLRDTLNEHEEHIDQLLNEPQKLEIAIRQAIDKRYRDASTRLSRGVTRSIIYIFLTKTVMAFLLELPYEAIFLHSVKITPLAINVIFHPVLMFLIATSIRVPATENTARIIKGVSEVVYNPPEREILGTREERIRTSGFLNAVFTGFYGLAFIITFGGIIWMLKIFEFSIVSAFLFLFFLSVISFFGLRLRHNAKEMVMVNKRQGAGEILFDFFAMPVLRAGRWISGKTSQINVFLFIMDFIIEAPFKVLIETVEDWVSFQREKKDEII
ncbi:MAG: hypothetical protein WCT27_03455 [Patescibacteria group bacterium]